MQNLTTCLWFEKDAESAITFYAKTFSAGGHTAEIGRVTRYNADSAKASGQPEGSVLTIDFTLDGASFFALNGGPLFKFTPAISFVINCGTQKEIDHFWSALGEGGEEGQCGWINRDRYGISWQIVPRDLSKWIGNPDRAKADAAMKAMLGMKKLDIEALKKAGE